MRRLTAARNDEHGAVLVLTVALTTTLVAMAALVVDVGSMLDERRQLQNGADASALAVAHSCAEGNCPIDTTMARTLANANALDGAATVAAVVVTNNQVKVTTSTKAANGGTILPHWFAQALTGNRGSTLHASATASWSGIARAVVIPLTISSCDFDRETHDGTVFNTSLTGKSAQVDFQGDKTNSYCPAKAGLDTDGDQRLPGGFGWLTAMGCQATISATDTVSEKPGASAPSVCNLTPLLNTTVLLPIFDDVNGLGGEHGTYHVRGFAALRLTGYRFPSGGTGGEACGKSCIRGYFTRLVTTVEAMGGPNLGAATVVLVS